MADRAVTPKPSFPVPSNIKHWHRILKSERSLNDAVETILTALMASDPNFAPYLNAIYDTQAVEGTCSADNIIAALRVREHATKNNVEEVRAEKLSTISFSIGVVLRRYGLSRKQRRLRVHGEIATDAENESGESDTDRNAAE